MFPKRFPTGIRKTTIVNPAFGNKDATDYQGDVSGYVFKGQAQNFLSLQAVLKENGTELGPIAASTYPAETWWYYSSKCRNLTRFVSCSKDGRLMWEKYEGNTPGGGHNHVFMAGRKMKLTGFLALKPELQRALLSGSELWIQMFEWPKWLIEDKDGPKVEKSHSLAGRI